MTIYPGRRARDGDWPAATAKRAPLPAPFPDRRAKPSTKAPSASAPAGQCRRALDASFSKLAGTNGAARAPRSRVSRQHPAPECPFRRVAGSPSERSHLLGRYSLRSPPGRAARPVPSLFCEELRVRPPGRAAAPCRSRASAARPPACAPRRIGFARDDPRPGAKVRGTITFRA